VRKERVRGVREEEWGGRCALNALRACSKFGILVLQTPKFYLAGSKRARKSGFLRSIDRKNPQFEQALTLFSLLFTISYYKRKEREYE
jgi:hypothetical protein